MKDLDCGERLCVTCRKKIMYSVKKDIYLVQKTTANLHAQMKWLFLELYLCAQFRIGCGTYRGMSRHQKRFIRAMARAQERRRRKPRVAGGRRPQISHEPYNPLRQDSAVEQLSTLIQVQNWEGGIEV